MTEQLTIDGGSDDLEPPQVPPVTWHAQPFQRKISIQRRVECSHCVMNADRWRAERTVAPDQRTITMWWSASDVTVLGAVYLITQRDGSTLYLCAQHAQEHTERGDRHG